MKHVLPILLLLALTWGCSKGTTSRSGAKGQTVAQATALTPSVLASARTNYTTYCAGCHGRDLETFVNRQWLHGNSPAALFKSIKHGYPEQGMLAYDTTFTDDQIHALVQYIRQGIAQKPNRQAAAQNRKVYQSQDQAFWLDTIATGLEVPWAMAFLPNGELLVTERSGILYRVTKGRQLQKITGTPEVLAQGQGGLLDVKLHPDFSKNKVLFLSYSAVKKDGGQTLSTTAIMRAKLEGNALQDQKLIFEAQPYAKARHHYGSRMEFGRDGNLYFTMGDRGGTKINPQNLEVHAGKTHRIKPDGSIPTDNPFVNQPKAQPSIFTYGNRNAQGLALHPTSGELWLHEHGPKGGDEVNIVKKGANYGWADVTYGIDYNGTKISDLKQKPGVTDPIHVWVPSIAPSGMAFLTSDRYKGWKGSLFVGSMSFKFLSRLNVSGNTITSEERLLQDIGRVRDVRMSPDGYLYIAVEKPGIIYRLVPASE